MAKTLLCVMIENWLTSANQKDVRACRIVDIQKRPTVFPREQRFSLQHLRKNAARTPDINGDVVFLPGQHDFRCSIIPGWHIASHLRILNTGQTKIADLQVNFFGFFPFSILNEWNDAPSDRNSRSQGYCSVSSITDKCQFYVDIEAMRTKSRCTTPAEWTYLSPR